MAMIDQDLREELHSAYGHELPPAAFSLDNVREGGRRRRRRRTAGRLVGTSVMTAVLVAAVTTGSGLMGGHSGATAPAGRSAATVTSCTTDMGECAWRVSQWAKNAGVPTSAFDRFTLNPGGASWEKGTWRLETTLTSDHDGLVAQVLAITLSPTTTDPVEARVDRSGLATHTIRLASGEVATSYEDSGGVKATTSWRVPARAGVHPAVMVEFLALDEVGDKARVPVAATGAQVRGLLEILAGPGRSQVPEGTRDEVNRSAAAEGGAAVTQGGATGTQGGPADPRPTIREWLRTTGHPEVVPPSSQRRPDGWDVLRIPVAGDRVTVRVSRTEPIPAADRQTVVTTPSGLTVRRQSATLTEGTQDDYTVADERFSGRVSVSVLHPGTRPATVTQDDALRLIDRLATQ